MRRYETVFILDPGLDDATQDKEIRRVEELIENHKGKVIQTDRWGLRRMFYRIKKKNEGFYVLIQFEAPASLIGELKRAYNLNENCLRSLVVLQKEKGKSVKKEMEPVRIEDSEKKVEA